MPPAIATDPPVSEAQRRAMFAAAAGKSKLGIPKKVGEEFVGKDADAGGMAFLDSLKGFARGFMQWIAEEEDEGEHGDTAGHGGDAAGDPAAKQAAGVMFHTPTGRALFLKRAEGGDHGGEWCLPGGGTEDGETPEATAAREAKEEVGDDCSLDAMSPLDRRTSDEGVDFSTFQQPVAKQFEPKLNDEHTGFAWAPLSAPPEPLHPGVKATLAAMAAAEDPSAEDAEAKLTKASVDYSPGKDDDRCKNCVHFETPAACQLVEGEIDPEYWCKRFLISQTGDAENPEGKLSEKTREEIGREGSETREDVPESVFLEPKEHKYPVKKKNDDEVWEYDRNLLLAAAREARMHGHGDLAGRADEIRAREFGKEDKAQDMALDFAARAAQPIGEVVLVTKSPAGIAFDRNSVRNYDADGRLHVAQANVSKANICPYWGREIPDHDRLGLDSDRMYRLFRDPDELRKAVPTFNNLPILSKHVPVSADSHPSDLVIGSTGTDADFADPYLTNSLVFWPQAAISNIENEAQKQLSSAYRYRADMTPGDYHGEPFDGVMRDIVGNHVALVKEGRAGPDVVVGDSKEVSLMSKMSRRAAETRGAIRVYLRPKLASAAKIDLDPILAGVTSLNFSDKKPAIIVGLQTAVKGKLAQDASIEDVAELLDVLEKEGAMDDTDANSSMPMGGEADDEWEKKAEDARKRLGRDETAEERDRRERGEDARHRMGRDETEEEKEKREGEDKRSYDRRAMDAKKRLGRDESEEEKKDREGKERAEDRKRAKDEPPAFKGKPEIEDKPSVVTKEAMDAAIAAAVKGAQTQAAKNQREIREAERAVRPWVGDLVMAHDSAEEVYRTALTALGVKVGDIHPSAFAALLDAQPRPDARRPAAVAMDAAGIKSFADRFPNAMLIKQA